MSRDCILVLFLPLYSNLHTNIQAELPLTKVLLTKTDETNEASGIVSISFKSWKLFCRLVHQATIIWRVPPAFLQEFLAIESFHNFAFVGTDGEPRHHLAQNCLHSTFAVEQLPIHFLRVSCTEKRNVEKSSITVSVNDFFFLNNLPDSIR